jgi:hypothetical protein
MGILRKAVSENRSEMCAKTITREKSREQAIGNRQ